MKKFSTRKGFTVAEVLIAVALLAIFVSMAIVGTTALFGTGEEMMTVSKAAVLGSDVMKIVTNELRFSLECTEKDGNIVYDSTSYGSGCTMKVDGGQLKIVSGEETGNIVYSPIGTAAYDEVHIKEISFAVKPVYKDEEKKDEVIRQDVSCTLSITSDGENILWEKTVTVVPLSQKATA